MSLHEIQEKILKEAHEKAALTLEEGKSESSKIVAQAKERSKQISDAAKKEVAMKIEMLWNEHKSGVEIERKNSVLVAREQVIDSQFGTVKRNSIAKMMQGSYKSMIKKAVANARELAGVNETVIFADKESQKILTELGYRSQIASAKGITIQTKDGSIKIDATIDGIMENTMEMIRSEIAGELFAQRKEQHARPKQSAKQKSKPKKATKKVAKKPIKKRK